MASMRERGGRWLHGELPGLVAAGVISEETARALERHYPETSAGSGRNFGFVLLAVIGSALVAAGIVLLIAHDWDEFSRPLRSAIAFLPLLAAQALSTFVLLRRDQSQPWRESAAIFNVAGIGTAIALVSQTYQIHGSFANFILVWMLLSLPLVYIMRTTLGASAYLIGAFVWLVNNNVWAHRNSPLPFWLLLLLVAPFFAMVYRRNRDSRETTAFAVVFAIVTAIGIGYTADFTGANLGSLALAGFFSAIYICGIEFFPARDADRLHPLALLAGLAIGVTTIVLTFEEIWTHVNQPAQTQDLARSIGVAIELFFPLVAIALAAWSFVRGKIHFSVLAAALPIVAGVAWLIVHLCLPEQITWSRSRCDMTAAVLFNMYALALGVELIARGLRADSVTRANFGLLVIAALAVARFFDSDLSFVTRAIGFIVIGLGFLLTNLFLFRKRTAK
ncbi:MAG: DUF2157 domain-containing protein [Chthoniobacterales bacterium]